MSSTARRHKTPSEPNQEPIGPFWSLKKSSNESAKTDSVRIQRIGGKFACHGPIEIWNPRRVIHPAAWQMINTVATSGGGIICRTRSRARVVRLIWRHGRSERTVRMSEEIQGNHYCAGRRNSQVGSFRKISGVVFIWVRSRD